MSKVNLAALGQLLSEVLAGAGSASKLTMSEELESRGIVSKSTLSKLRNGRVKSLSAYFRVLTWALAYLPPEERGKYYAKFFWIIAFPEQAE